MEINREKMERMKRYGNVHKHIENVTECYQHFLNYLIEVTFKISLLKLHFEVVFKHSIVLLLFEGSFVSCL